MELGFGLDDPYESISGHSMILGLLVISMLLKGIRIHIPSQNSFLR